MKKPINNCVPSATTELKLQLKSPYQKPKVPLFLENEFSQEVAGKKVEGLWAFVYQSCVLGHAKEKFP